MLLSLRPLARTAVEVAEAEVAMGEERAHAEFGGQGHGDAEMCLGSCHIGSLLMRNNLAQEAECPRLMTAFTAFAGKHHGTVGARAGVLGSVREQIRLAELHDAD